MVTVLSNRIHIPGQSCTHLKPQETMEVPMGTVVIRCPATGITLPTGIRADRLKFACSPVFFADTYCPACETEHRWFAREAWVEEPEAAEAA
jgi:hypothetical protein